MRWDGGVYVERIEQVVSSPSIANKKDGGASVTPRHASSQVAMSRHGRDARPIIGPLQRTIASISVTVSTSPPSNCYPLSVMPPATIHVRINDASQYQAHATKFKCCFVLLCLAD